MKRLALLLWCGAAMAEDPSAAVRQALAAAGQAKAQFALPARPFPACSGPLRAQPHRQAWAQADILCDTPPWRRLIRLDAAAEPSADPRAAAPEGTATRMAVVTLRPVPRGGTIGPEDVTLAPIPVQSAADSFADVEAVIGDVARAALSGGQPLLARQLQPQWAVHADRPARLSVRVGRILVLQSVLPLQDAETGATIRIRHPDSGQILWARVTGIDSLEVQTNTD